MTDPDMKTWDACEPQIHNSLSADDDDDDDKTQEIREC
jgi:hypothetical protein